MPRKKEVVPITEVESKVIQTEEVNQPRPLPQQSKQLDLHSLKCCYIVGLSKEGQFIFEVVGQERGLVELLGIHQFASRRIDKIFGETQISGDRLVHEVGKGLQELGNAVGKILNYLGLNSPPQGNNTNQL